MTFFYLFRLILIYHNNRPTCISHCFFYFYFSIIKSSKIFHEIIFDICFSNSTKGQTQTNRESRWRGGQKNPHVTVVTPTRNRSHCSGSPLQIRNVFENDPREKPDAFARAKQKKVKEVFIIHNTT